MINFLSLLFIFSNAQDLNLLRQFKAIDGQSKVHLLVDRESNPVKFYFKLYDTDHEDNNKVFLFFMNENDRFAPVNGASKLLFMKSKTKTLVKGTLKNFWILSGLKNSIHFEEQTNVKKVTGNSLKDEYLQAEGANFNSDKSILDEVSRHLLDKCKIKPNISMGAFKTTPAYKLVPAISSLASLCDDPDYQSEIKKITKISVSSSNKTDSAVASVKNNVLILDLGNNLQNTKASMRKILERTF